MLRDNRENFVRDGMFWKPLRRLLGNGILGFGKAWQSSRRILQPMFTTRHVQTLMTDMTAAIVTAVERFEPHAHSGEPLEATVAMTRIVHRAVSRVFFGDRITVADFDRLAPAIDLAANSATSRMLMPFVPHAVPMPGDRAFNRSVRTIEEVLLPLIDEARTKDPVKGDIVSTLCHARNADGSALTDTQIRDDVVAMFAAGTETTAVALAWLWVALEQPARRGPAAVRRNRPCGRPRRATRAPRRADLHPDGAAGADPALPGGLARARQTIAADIIGSVRIPAGATVLLSPYFTHRHGWLWSDARHVRPATLLARSATSGATATPTSPSGRPAPVHRHALLHGRGPDHRRRVSQPISPADRSTRRR